MQTMKPNARTKIALSGKRSKPAYVPCETVSQCGGVIVITQHQREDESLGDGYGLTHRLTGFSLTGGKLTNDLKRLKTKARKFWRSLPDDVKKTWCTSDDPRVVARSTPPDSVQILRS